MKVRLAFALITVTALGAVACQPQGRPTPEPNRPPQKQTRVYPACANEWESNGSETCLWRGGPGGRDVLNFPDGTYRVL